MTSQPVRLIHGLLQWPNMPRIGQYLNQPILRSVFSTFWITEPKCLVGFNEFLNSLRVKMLGDTSLTHSLSMSLSLSLSLWHRLHKMNYYDKTNRLRFITLNVFNTVVILTRLKLLIERYYFNELDYLFMNKNSHKCVLIAIITIQYIFNKSWLGNNCPFYLIKRCQIK